MDLNTSLLIFLFKLFSSVFLNFVSPPRSFIFITICLFCFHFLLLGAAQNPNRQLLWHGSRTTNYLGILSQGLRIAPPEAPVPNPTQ
jgi:hypothetical protein